MLKLAIVSPCYNEELVLPSSVKKLSELFEDLKNRHKITEDSFVLFVNDGSKDGTWNILQQYHRDFNFISAINLTTNTGHQNAIMAGMMVAKDMCDAVITIDADLQDDLNCIEQMIELYEQGRDVVYGFKKSRTKDGFIKKTTAEMFYKIQSKMGIKSVYNHADFRLVSKSVLERLSKYHEKNLYLRGLIPMICHNPDYVEDTISERVAGQSKYTLNKMINLACDGILSFSIRPISLIFMIAFIFFICFLGSLVYILVSLLTGHVVPGWASIMASIWIIGASIIFCLGIVGAYIGKTFIEVKSRPLFNIEEALIDEEQYS